MEEKRKLYNEYLESKASDPPQRPQQRLDVDANHGLWAFFRRLNINGKERYEVIATKEDHTELLQGRAWKASELRRKSFKDLHILWYILLRERNILATQKEEARRLRISPYRRVPRGREATCKRSQARILTVINQRRIAYEEAVKLQHEQTLRETDVSMQPDIDLSPKDKATKPEPLERAERILRRRRSRLHPIVIERANSWRDGAGEVLGRRTSSDSGKKEPPRSVVDNLMVPESVTPPSQSMANQ
ncbi:MRP-L47-domain-containing protein [Rickenella mellea]|uniref:Large ribosomal subunit protein uL29m n=1 Tax=Rickenella mellea TaxID=50990 RepID=A0A4Y7PTI0_9AGAM|nr:MRP-L47-domain-containing protein [Rickenella mellea]